MKPKLTFETDLAAYVSIRQMSETSHDVKTLRMLGGSEQFCHAWHDAMAVDSVGARRTNPSLVLDLILECFDLAPVNRDVPTHRQQRKAGLEQLCLALGALSERYARMPLLQESGGARSPLLDAHNRGLQNTRESLKWMEADLARALRFDPLKTFPNSQKRNGVNAERLAFQKMLSSRFDFFCGDSNAALVAATAEILYAAAGDLDVESQKKAVRDERKRRAK